MRSRARVRSRLIKATMSRGYPSSLRNGTSLIDVYFPDLQRSSHRESAAFPCGLLGGAIFLNFSLPPHVSGFHGPLISRSATCI